ncbi:MAG: diacylglycerol kinase family lipid kinase [Pirellulaceae bacterium]|nr:diacylglycerol kinase family lipid kinase [Pirellulaceae bacterium]
MPTPTQREVVILVNPNAGARTRDDEVGRLVETLASRGHNTHASTNLDGACREANDLHASGRLQTLVGVGGDGTLAELVNRTEHGVPIAILPAGTANLLSRHLGFRRSVAQWVEAIAAGRTIRLDAGRANGRLFTLMLGCGFDAQVVRELEAGRTGHIGRFAYFGPIARALAHYDFPEMRIYCDDCEVGSEEGTHAEPFEAGWLFAFNLPCYGGGFRFTPAADGRDGLLDVCTFRRTSRWHGMRYFAALVLRSHRRLADCRFVRTSRLRIEAEGKVPYQLDGDFAGYLPVEVEILPERLTLVIPPDSPYRPTDETAT